MLNTPFTNMARKLDLTVSVEFNCTFPNAPYNSDQITVVSSLEAGLFLCHRHPLAAFTGLERNATGSMFLRNRPLIVILLIEWVLPFLITV